ncbi:hypothetical protein scyTo_0001314 [Scyliorhinus torazame]|uniref:Uncharacterized protein n=1 Tax=Scyliorhinus torazame TaxID=75743 RepID=A0A401PBR7_SCYTO|nr:hypothetical protein [Scyliorhinus torazame]
MWWLPLQLSPVQCKYKQPDVRTAAETAAAKPACEEREKNKTALHLEDLGEFNLLFLLYRPPTSYRNELDVKVY